jgi:hypothetical protein
MWARTRITSHDSPVPQAFQHGLALTAVTRLGDNGVRG